MYLNFRSYISKPERNLPQSNALSHSLLSNANSASPENDMQVRLANQELGGPLADVEIVGPVAEGNHWQWPLTSKDINASIMPSEMADRIPHDAMLLAYYQTLNEIGILFPAQ
jgi:hypothetical protein